MRHLLARWWRHTFSTSKHHKRSYRLDVEALEERFLPSNLVLTVNSAGDDPFGPTVGVTTLRDAITAVNNDAADNPNSPDVIQFAIAGTPTITLTADLPALANPALIDGSTQAGVTIDGQAASGANSSQGFAVLVVGAAVTEQDITFTDGSLTVNAGGSLAVNGNFNLGDGNGDSTVVQNSGTVSISGNVAAGDNTVLNNNSGATFQTVGLSMGAGSYFVDNGTMSASGAFDPGPGSQASDNIIGGTFTGLAGSTVTTDTATWDVLAGGALNDNGSFVDNGTVNVAGTLTSAGASSVVVDEAGQLHTENMGQLNIQGTMLQWSNPADITYGTALGSAQLDATAIVMSGTSVFPLSGTFTYTPATGTVLGPGQDQVLDVTFKPKARTLASASAQVMINVLPGAQATPVLTVNPINLVYGTALANDQLIGTASVTVNNQTVDINGTFMFTSAAGTVLNAGAGQSEAVSFTPVDTADYTNATGTVIVNVGPANQTIVVTEFAPADAVYGTSFTVSALASSGLPVAISASGVASGSGMGSATITMTSGTGTGTITFSQAGNSNYNAATVIVETVTAEKATQTISVTQAAPSDAVYGTSFTVAASASSGLDVSIAASGGASGSGTDSANVSMTSGTDAGSVTFSQAGDDDYNAATLVESVTADKASQTITVTAMAPAEALYGTGFTVSATASSGDPVAILASGAASGSGTGDANISMTSGTGTGAVTFSQAGDDNYSAASVVVENVTAEKANQTITITEAAPAEAVYGTSFTVSATASSGDAVAISGSGAASGSGSGTTSIATSSGTGTGTVTFSQAGDGNYNAATAVVENVTAEKANQTITVTQAAPAAAVYGTSFTVSATASSGDAVAISASGAASGGGSGSASVTMTSGTGTATVTFSEAGDSNYNAATAVVETVTAEKANQTITVTKAAPANAAYGSSFTVSATASSGLSVAISASGAASGSGSGTATITMSSAAGTGTVTFSQAGNANYNAASAVVENVTDAKKASQTITVTHAAPAYAVYGSCFVVAATASSGLPVNISASGCCCGSGTGTATITITGCSGTATITFTQAGNADYASVSVTETVKIIPPGVSVVGTELWYVGSNQCCSDNNVVYITPAGASATGSTGIAVNGKVYKQSFSAIRIFLYNGNDVVSISSRLTISTFINAGDGNNTIAAGNSNNSLTLGNGRDYVLLGDGNNTLTLGKGNDSVVLGNGNNTICLGNGNDNVVLGKGNNTATLGNGNDNLLAGNGNNNLSLGNGNDNVYAGNGSNVIVTGNGNDNIWAGSGDNLIAAGLGQHSVWVGNGSNILIDGSVRLTQSGDSLRAVLDDWTQYGKSATDVADIRRRLAVTDNTAHANLLHAGTDLDWFWYTYGKDSVDRKATDLLN